MHTIITGIFHFKVLPLSIASTDTDPPATFPSRNIARYRSGVISLASRRWWWRRGGEVNRFRDRETKSGERSMNRSHGLAHRFQEGNGASSSDGGARRWQRDDPPRGVVALVWVADASGADSARARVASCSGGTPARCGAAGRKRGNQRRARG